jgi:O-succinylhomoserine sulfhydrylase
MSPFNAWVVLKGLETMDLRVRRMSQNARSIADRLATHPKINAVRYPGRSDHPHHNIHAAQMPEGGGSMLAFSIKGGRDASYAMLNKLGLVEDAEDIAEDIEQALG